MNWQETERGAGPAVGRQEKVKPSKAIVTGTKCKHGCACGRGAIPTPRQRPEPHERSTHPRPAVRGRQRRIGAAIAFPCKAGFPATARSEA